MIFQVQTTTATAFRWRPAYLPDPTVAPTVNFYANDLVVTKTLAAKESRTVVSVPDRYRIQLGAISSGDLAGEVGVQGGMYWLHLLGFGQYEVRVSHLDDANNQVVLSEALPVGLPTDASGTLYHNDWRCTINAGELGATTDRAGYYKIEYTIDDAPLHDIGTRTKTERGRLRVVLATFDTGLSSRELMTLFPQLEATRPSNREGWQAYIDHYDLITELEAKLPRGRFCDMVIGEQFRRAHAYFVAAALSELGYLPNSDPDRLREIANEEIERQVSRMHWIDLDSDGVVDLDEIDVNNTSLVNLSVSSNNSTTNDYLDGKRFRPKLSDHNDR